MRIRSGKLNVSSEEKCLHCRLETVQGCRVANGARQPVSCRRTCDDECTSAELCPRPLNYKVAASRRPSSTFKASTLELSQSSDKYAGASSCIALYIIRHSLNWMRCATGSQCCRSRIKPVTCEYFPAPQSILAAAFITRRMFSHKLHLSVTLPRL